MFDDTTFEGAIITALFSALDPFVSSCIMYLMIERNNDEYVQALSILYKSKILCCWNCLMRDTLEYIDPIKQNRNNVKTKDVQKKENEKTESIYETNDISIEMHHKRYIDTSVSTERTNRASEQITVLKPIEDNHLNILQ